MIEFTENTMCYNELIKKGFTKKIIQQLLPEPELRKNPHCRWGRSMKVWRVTDVITAMETDEYKNAAIRQKIRSEKAKKAVETKIRNLIEEYQDIIHKIPVERVEMDALKRLSMKNDQSWYKDLPVLICGRKRYTHDEIDEVWLLENVIHHLTDYDRMAQELDEELFRKIGKKHIQTLFFVAVMEGIAETYPEFAEECRFQIQMRKLLDKNGYHEFPEVA